MEAGLALFLEGPNAFVTVGGAGQQGECMAFEAQATGGEFVDVRCLDLRGSVATELGAEVVDGDEQDVGPLAACRSCC